MKKVVTIVALFATGLLMGIYFYSPDRNVIDEAYISSNGYRALEKKLEKDRAENLNKKTVLNLVARKMLADSMPYNPDLPYRLDSLAAETLMTSVNKIRLNNAGLGQTEFKRYGFYKILTLTENSIESVFFLMKSPGIYKEIDVVLATLKDSSIVDIESVGRFEKNIAEKTASSIQIRENKIIKTRMVKIRSYPVRQKNIINYRYTIKSDGTIEVNVTSNQ